MALQKNLCVDVKSAIEMECLHNTATPLKYSIVFTRKASNRCRKLASQLTEQGINVIIKKCDFDTPHEVQTTMTVEQLKWVSMHAHKLVTLT